MITTNTISAKTVFISDIHLGSKDCKVDKLIDFLKKLQCEEIYLLGDIIDLWSLKKRMYWPSSHYEVIKQLLKKAQSNTRVVYIPGNHDQPIREYDKSFFAQIEIQEEAIYTSVTGEKYLLFHGDSLDEHIRFGWLSKLAGDFFYPLLLVVNRWFGGVRNRLGYDYWSLSSYIKTLSAKAIECIEIYEVAAAAEASRRGLDGVICGHIHQPRIREINGVRYCNDGDWVEHCTALIETHEGKIELLNCANFSRAAVEKPVRAAA